MPLPPAIPESIGRYRVIERIGKGSMGVVYAAHDAVMGRDVAVKILMTDLESEPEIRARFTREAQVCARLAHPNIVTVYDIDEDETGRLFIVMELLRGQTLADRLKRGPLPIEEKISLILEVCDGLAVASAAGVCHRDVKPGNLFLKSDGGVKILDFGIARLASSNMTAGGYIVGTPDFMSPEQARGVSIDERSDIFSVGAVLYLLLARRKPFVAPDLPAVLHRVVSDDPAPIDEADAPQALARIVFKALAKDPNQRFQNFPELARDLAQWRGAYQRETDTLAEQAATNIEYLQRLATEDRQAAEAIGARSEADFDAWMSEIGAGYPDLLANGPEALRANPWNRSHVEDVAARIDSITSVWTPRVAGHREAAESLATAKKQLGAGDARAALAGLEDVLQRVPSAPIQADLERARRLRADQQAQEDRLSSLLRDASEAMAKGQSETVLALAQEALRIDPQHAEARDFLARAERNLKAAEAERARQCEKSLDRARRALQVEQLEEAERQLELAKQSGAALPDIAVVSAAIAEARTARDKATAVVREVATELAAARTEFQKGERPAALARLRALTVRYPSNAAAQTELARLLAEHSRLATAEKAAAEAERLAQAAADAMALGDDATARQLADQALALAPGQELALRTSVVAQAHERERAERKAREDQAHQLFESATALLAQGRFDRAIKEARRAAELDPTGTAAPALMAEAFRRQSEAAAAEARERDEARRRTEVSNAVQAASKALRANEFSRARMLAEQAVAIDPDNVAAKDLIDNIAAAAARAAATFDDDETTRRAASGATPPATGGQPSAWRWITSTLRRSAASAATPAPVATSVGSDDEATVIPQRKSGTTRAATALPSPSPAPSSPAPPRRGRVAVAIAGGIAVVLLIAWVVVVNQISIPSPNPAVPPAPAAWTNERVFQTHFASAQAALAKHDRTVAASENEEALKISPGDPRGLAQQQEISALDEVSQAEQPAVDEKPLPEVDNPRPVRPTLTVAPIKGESARDRAAREKEVKTFLDDAKTRMKEGQYAIAIRLLGLAITKSGRPDYGYTPNEAQQLLDQARQKKEQQENDEKARKVEELFAKARDQATDIVGRLRALQEVRRLDPAKAGLDELAGNLQEQARDEGGKAFLEAKNYDARRGRGKEALVSFERAADLLEWVPGAEENLNYARKRRDELRAEQQ